MAEVSLAPAWQPYWDSFRRAMKAERLSDNTLRAYGLAYWQLATFLGARSQTADPRTVSRDDVRAFIGFLNDRHAANTARNRFMALRRFFGWMVDEGELDHSPMERMKAPTLPDSPVGTIPFSVIRRLLATCAGRSFEDRRDTALVMFLLDTGARASEVATMKLAGLDLDEATAEVTGKGAKGKGPRPRLVVFGKKTARDLDRYLRVRAQHFAADSKQVWVGARGDLTYWGVRYIILERATQAKLEDRLKTHLFRHTWADDRMSSAMAEGDIMRLAGWRSRSMLDRYAAAKADRRAHEAAKRSEFPGDRI